VCYNLRGPGRAKLDKGLANRSPTLSRLSRPSPGRGQAKKADLTSNSIGSASARPKVLRIEEILAFSGPRTDLGSLGRSADLPPRGPSRRSGPCAITLGAPAVLS
jgi:hypothetical protein